MKISLLLLAILASAADAQIQNQVPPCAYESGSTSCENFADAMSGWNSAQNNILGTGICTAWEDGLCAEACTPQDMDGCGYVGGGGGGGGSGAICFTGESLLTLEDGSTKNFHSLEVGDVILGANRNGTISASPVLFIPHPKNTNLRQFDEIELVNGMVVRMTRNHLVPLCDGSLVTARSLKEGDCLTTTKGMSKVAKVTQNVEASGIYTAVTKNEFLMVDGVMASPFALAHGIAHSLFDREDVSEWCKTNEHLVQAANAPMVKAIVSRRRLTVSTTACMDLMETLFENYKDEGVGWGTNGWGYKNFKTTEMSLANFVELA